MDNLTKIVIVMKQAIILIVLAALFALQVQPTVFTQVGAVICALCSLLFAYKWQSKGNDNNTTNN